uniref:Calcium-activated potassium channel BK alpha subunit domain-containing protein n=1 Tax=Ditylenchus dipsaci TaxID=166011 RepID=A0A915D9P3_9BILA
MQHGKQQGFKARLQEYFLEDEKTSMRIRQFNLFIKLLSCVLYCVRVQSNETEQEYLPSDVKAFYAKNRTAIPDYEYLLWGNVLRLLLNIHFLLELVTGAPLIATMFAPSWRSLYVPIFLNCWLASSILQDILNNFQRMSHVNPPLYHTVRCLFNSLYFITVTFSTVGYGDWFPDWWMSRFYVIILIVVAFVVLPSKIEALGQTWVEREKAGFDYTKGLSKESGHVVVTITHLEPDFIQDFLNEFFAHSRHQGYLVVLLSPCDLDNRMKLLLKTPLWSHRVIYIRGTALKDEDLERAHMATARACFILSARHVKEKNASDEQTILRSWAVADFAPNVPQYVQIFGQEMKVHIARAAVVICEDEFKYSLLANNCICPAISTFITLLMHTSRGKEGQKSNEAWQRVYGFHSGNEIYDICVTESKFFEEYVGKTFTFASFHAHQLYGVCLVGVKRDVEGAKIMLNPGESHMLQPSDRVYYIALTSEESLREFHLKQKECNQLSSRLADIENNLHEEDWLCQSKKRTFLTKLANKRRKNESSSLIQLNAPPINRNSARLEHMDNVEGTLDSARLSAYLDTDRYDNEIKNGDYKCELCAPDVCLAKRTSKTQPPIIGSYTSSTVTICHMLKIIRPLCCLELNQPCDHSSYTTAQDYNWQNPVIVAVDKITSGLYNVLFPLRAFYLSVHELQPIIFLLELGKKERPSKSFLETIAWFPEVFWMKGKLSSLDDLLVAGICEAEHVIVLKENNTMEDEFVSRTNFGIDIGADCTTIITARKIHRMFPGLKLTTELTYSSNMRFLSNLQFDSDVYSMQQSRCEEQSKQHRDEMAEMVALLQQRNGDGDNALPPQNTPASISMLPYFPDMEVFSADDSDPCKFWTKTLVFKACTKTVLS